MPSCISFLFSGRDIQGCILLLEVLKFKNNILGIFEIIYFFLFKSRSIHKEKSYLFQSINSWLLLLSYPKMVTFAP